jgi:hypothetical protein
MALFEFELAKVEDIIPWGAPGQESLSWFALTDGWFRILVGEQVLFRYTEEILSHWGGASARDADYQVAAFADDVLGTIAAAVAPLPREIERLASSWDLLTALRAPAKGDDESEQAHDRSYTAWRWLGERSPWASYLVAHPNFQFVRIGNELRIHWDNRDRIVDGIPVWTAQRGVYAMPVEKFLDESRSFGARLLDSMSDRITEIAAGRIRPRVEVSLVSLREQHERARATFASYFREYEPDVPWGETVEALHLIAKARQLSI